MVRIHRRRIEEDRFYQLLTDVRFGLKRSTKLQQVGGFELRSRMHPFDFLVHAIPAWWKPALWCMVKKV